MGKLFVLLFQAIFTSWSSTNKKVESSTQTITTQVAEVASTQTTTNKILDGLTGSVAQLATNGGEQSRAVIDGLTSNLGKQIGEAQSITKTEGEANRNVVVEQKTALYSDLTNYIDTKFAELNEFKEAFEAAEKFKISDDANEKK